MLCIYFNSDMLCIYFNSAEFSLISIISVIYLENNGFISVS